MLVLLYHLPSSAQVSQMRNRNSTVKIRILSITTRELIWRWRTNTYIHFQNEELELVSKLHYFLGFQRPNLDDFPCTAEQFFEIMLKDGSDLINEFHSLRKDTNLIIGAWRDADEYDGQVREVTFRSLCNSPMCPPDTAVTELQHVVLSPDKNQLVYETFQQAHDVPFGSCFEVHGRWCLKTNSESSCNIEIRVGAHFKKWCILQSKIRSGAVGEYKKEVELMISVARSYVKPKASPSISDILSQQPFTDF